MFKKLVLLSAITVSLTACQGMNIVGMVSAASNLAQATTISDEDVRALGFKSQQQLDAEHRIASPSSKYSQRLARITRPLRNYNGHQLNFKVYLTNEVNAFALPNGGVRVYSALMDKMTDDELLFVIGHELGHVMLGHSKAQIRTSLLSTAALQAAASSGSNIVAALSGSQLGTLAHGLVNSQYSQSQEYEADAYGVKILHENGKTSAPAASALRKLVVPGQSSGGISSLFSDHPESEARAERVEKM